MHTAVQLTKAAWQVVAVYSPGESPERQETLEAHVSHSKRYHAVKLCTVTLPALRES